VTGIILGAVGLGVTAGFGLAQLRSSRRTDERAEPLPREIGDVVASQLRVVLASVASKGGEQTRAQLDLVGVHYADINKMATSS
jgi:hypothetical protein